MGSLKSFTSQGVLFSHSWTFHCSEMIETSLFFSVRRMKCLALKFIFYKRVVIWFWFCKKKNMVYGIGWDFLLWLLYHSVFIIYRALMCIHFLLLLHKLPHTWWLNTNNINFLNVTESKSLKWVSLVKIDNVFFFGDFKRECISCFFQLPDTADIL